MQLFVKSLSGQTLTVDAGAQQSVADVKSALQVKQGTCRTDHGMMCVVMDSVRDRPWPSVVVCALFEQCRCQIRRH